MSALRLPTLCALIFVLFAARPSGAPQDPAAAAAKSLLVVAGGSTVVQTPFAITRFAISNPAIADATVVEPR
jgi:Flp pilus assembly secretin CpaC